MKLNKKNGISLIILLITIVIVIILASAVIVSITNNNPISEASKMAFETDVNSFKAELDTYNTKQNIDKPRGYSSSKLQANETSITYDGVEDTNNTIYDIMPLLGSMPKYHGLFEVENGKLKFMGTDTTQKEWVKEMGMEIIIIGEPKVTITAASETVVAPGTDVTYTVEFSSNVGLTTIDLTNNVEVLTNGGTLLSPQPTFVIGSVTGTPTDLTRSQDVTINTSSLSSGAYKIMVKAGSATNVDGVSNMKDTIALTSFNIDTTPPTNPIMLASPTGWTNGNVTVSVTYSADSAIMQYSTNGTTWNAYTSSVVVNTNNTTVYAKAIDAVGNQSGQSTITIANIDKTIPTVAYGTNGGSGSAGITTVTVSDLGGSLVDTSTLQYVWDTQNTATPSNGWTTFANGDTLTESGVTGTYYLWIKANDNAGNSVVSKTNSFTLLSVNSPVLAAGMTAKKWDGSSWVTVANPATDTSWYDYANKQWANAQTADGSMWVWIPRYEYKIPTPHSATAQTIAVNFLNGKSTTATSGYTVHPAFTFGSTELTGIWIAKFEAGGTTAAVDVKPGVLSLKQTTISDMFTACRNMETNSRYGWGTSGSGIDTHMMKNIEWGVTSYLAESIYGKNSEVWINPNSAYLTGQAGTSASAASTATTYVYTDLTYGVQASTTGNVYGVYDLSGGASEYTAAYINNGNAVLTTYGANLVSAPSQYKDLYIPSGETQTGNYAASSSKFGDAVYETSTTYTGFTSWYIDASYMPYTTTPFFIRGGYHLQTTNSGIFCFAMSNGMVYNNVGFRPVLAVDSAL